MIEIAIILGVAIILAWAFWENTNISGRIATAFESFTLNPQEQEEMKTMDEPNICSPDGATVRYAPFNSPMRIAPPPSPPKITLAVPLGTFDHPNRVLNKQLGEETSITDMPFLYKYPQRNVRYAR